MREIKFRAWDRIHKKFVDTAELLSLPFHHFVLGTVTDAGGYVLQQFTGLHDKNGKEIYEGDIVRLSYDGSLEFAGDDAVVGVVEWGANGVDEYYPAFDVKDNDMETNALSCAKNNGEIEIIGNIYENPELLKP